ncbi:MAG: cob(I)yrinic acid a,c-diamide adenosyltransferase [Odoribacter sp.]|nr:cob(I)yrinic acid a,c-diamide adenosyltransferase [Odoribacter sp.]
MKIYTKTGDKGMTSLIGGKRVPKNSIRLESYGTIDELNSYLGVIRSFVKDGLLADELVEIQSRLFDIGGHLATDPDNQAIKIQLGVNEASIQLLEKAIDRMDAEVPPLKYFVLPGGNQIVAFCHVARTVCRRAERRMLDLAENSNVDESVLKYINRLSDYLFILSRKMAHDAGMEEHKWIPGAGV